MNWTDHGNDLESFLLEEVPAVPAEAEFSGEAEDEFGDIDWCGLEDVLKEDFEVADGAASTSQQQSNAADPESQSVSAKPKEGSEQEKPSEESFQKEEKEQTLKVRRQRKALREQAVAQYRLLVLSFELVQAAVLSLAPNCLDEGVKVSLRKIKAQLSGSAASMVPSPPSLLRLCNALHGAGSNMDLLLLLVSRCRSQLLPARLVLSLPLPGAKNCGSLLKADILPEPSLWVEIFDSTVKRWRALGVPSGHSSYWILAMGSHGDVWDVTGRYGRWSGTVDARGSLSKVRQDQLIDPQSAKAGKEAIWRREDVKDLCTATRWRQQGRAVRQDERPVLRRDSLYCSKLFGRWQTDELPDANVETRPVGYGPIPGGLSGRAGINNYGNIEVSQGIPQGCVHVDDEAARMAAPRLGVEFAPAVISFRKERGQLKPVTRCGFREAESEVYSGCVVWSRDEADLRAAAEDERQRLEEIQQTKRRERLRNAWRLLVKNVALGVDGWLVGDGLGMDLVDG
eukprot:Skav228421  [mRNA]  locus=scaffold1325:174076:180488:- [translate_table: standard]